MRRTGGAGKKPRKLRVQEKKKYICIKISSRTMKVAESSRSGRPPGRLWSGRPVIAGFFLSTLFLFLVFIAASPPPYPTRNRRAYYNITVLPFSPNAYPPFSHTLAEEIFSFLLLSYFFSNANSRRIRSEFLFIFFTHIRRRTDRTCHPRVIRAVFLPICWYSFILHENEIIRDLCKIRNDINNGNNTTHLTRTEISTSYTLKLK